MLRICQLTFIYIFSYIFLKAPIWLHPFTVPQVTRPLFSHKYMYHLCSTVTHATALLH